MKLQLLLASLVLCSATNSAQAGLLPVNVNITTEGSNARYAYSVLLQSDAVLKTGDYFTIYDFAGLIDGSNQQPANFSFTSAGTGLTPSHLLADDDPGMPNLTWTYTGATTKVGELALGSFSALSHYHMTREDSFTGQTHREVDGRLNGNITDTQVPVPCHMPPPVPEPSSFLLLAAGLPLLLGMRAYRKLRGSVA